MKKAIFPAGAVAALIGTLGSGSAFAASGDTAVISGDKTVQVCIYVTNQGSITPYTGSNFAANITGTGYEAQILFEDFVGESCKNVKLPAGNYTVAMQKSMGANVTSYTYDSNKEKLHFDATKVSSDTYLTNYGLSGQSTAATKVEISFDANGGTGTIEPVVDDYTSAITLPANTLTKADYVFDSWNTKADGSGTSYADGASINFAQGGEVTLYAQWRASVAVLDTGININKKLKEMAGTDTSWYSDPARISDTHIKALKTASALPEGFDVNDTSHIISASDSVLKIYAWFDDSDYDEDGEGDGIINLYSSADQIRSGINMNYMFSSMDSLSDISPLADWDTSKAYSMAWLFRVTSISDISPIANWNTSNVRNMSDLLSATKITNVDAIRTTRRQGNDYVSWDVSNVTDMSNMFWNSSLLGDISGLEDWDTSNVENMHMMFGEGGLNRKPLSDISPLTNWNTSKVKSMSYMFNRTSIANVNALETKQYSGNDYVSWDVSKVEDMNWMFEGDINLSDIAALYSWNTSSVKDMSRMFGRVSIVNTDVLETKQYPGKDYVSWDVSNVINMSWMFEGNTNLSNIAALYSWNTSKVNSMSYMFSNTSITNTDALETKQHSDKTYTSWDVSGVKDMSNMFNGCGSLSDISKVASWNTSNAKNMSGVFVSTAITSVMPIADWDTSNVEDMSSMIANTPIADISPLATWNTSKVINMSAMFSKTSITNTDALETKQYTGKDYISWDVSKVEDLSYIFSSCGSLNDITAISSWNVSSVTNMYRMFWSDSRIASLVPIFDWAVGQSVNMTDMFYGIPSTVQRPSWYQQ